jgi:hypothetical protein
MPHLEIRHLLVLATLMACGDPPAPASVSGGEGDSGGSEDSSGPNEEEESGDPSGPPGSTGEGFEFEERCNQLCDASGTECADEETGCLAECRARTQWLPTACGICIIDESGYDSGCIGGDDGGVTCSCSGMTFGKVSDDACVGFCGDIEDVDTSWDERCETLCAWDGDACDASDSAACVEECRVQVSGLSTGCAICLLDNSAGLTASCAGGDDGGTSCSCTGADIASISDEACSSFCAAG